MKTSLLIAACALLAGPAGAVTLTFDTVQQGGLPGPVSISEQGVTITADRYSDGVVYFRTPGTIHVDDSGTSFTSNLEFRTGGIFSALWFEAIGLGQSAVVDDGIDWVPVAYDNIRVQGFLDGVRVGETFFSTGLTINKTTYALGQDFAGIDLLRIPAIGASGQMAGGLPIQCFDAPCGHFDLDSLSLAPVPLPAALPLSAAGIGMLAMLRRRRG